MILRNRYGSEMMVNYAIDVDSPSEGDSETKREEQRWLALITTTTIVEPIAYEYIVM